MVNVVPGIVRTLNLGALTKLTTAGTGKGGSTGVVDYTWQCAVPGCGALRALVKVKYKTSKLDTAAMFEDSVRQEAEAGTATAGAIYLCLSEVIRDRPQIFMDVVHGLPVFWGFRDTKDVDLTSSFLTERAFTMMVRVWRDLQQQQEEGGDSTVLLQMIVDDANANMFRIG